MRPSMFNLRVPLEAQGPEAAGDVFLMNTLTDAQVIVSRDVADLMDRYADGGEAGDLSGDELEAIELLTDNGFLVESRDADQRALDHFFATVKSDTSELHITVLTTLQCNFACDYCF